MEKVRKTGSFICAFSFVILTMLFVLTGCQSQAGYTVVFNTCTSLETTKIKDRTVSPGETMKRPNVSMVDDEYSNYIVTGWYVDEDYTKEWNFDTDKVESDMVLYAKWEERVFVRYFVSNEKDPIEGEYLTVGSYAAPKPERAMGYKLIGYYADAGYSIPFDFEEPITKDTDIYMLLSESIYWDATAIQSGFITEASTGEGSTVGSIEVVEDEAGESYAKVDFGYSKSTDARIQSTWQLDMTKSQILTITYRNLGNAQNIRIYWMVTYEDGTYSGPDGERRLYSYFEKDIKSGMSEDDEWETLTIDMGEATVVNGESQWADGQILNILRIDSRYCEGMDEEFVPNIIEFKEISFATAEKYQSTDSVELSGDDVFAVMEAGNAQESIKNGYVFPKNRTASNPKQGTIQYNMEDAVTYLFPYGTKKGLVSFDMSALKLDMKENQLLYLKYKNEGYGKYLTIRYTTKDGKSAEKQVKIKTKMKVYSTLCINMLNDEDWDGQLDTLNLIYHKQGTNNVFSLQSLYLEPFEAADLPGINFVDDECAGFKDNESYTISYDTKNEISFLKMLTKSVTLTKNVSIDTSIYDTLTFTYSMSTVGVDSITLGYQIGSKWYTQQFDGIGRTSGMETLTMPLEKKGIVTKMKIEFSGKGSISMRSLVFAMDQTYALDFSDGSYVQDYFNPEWTVNYAVDYDAFKGAAYLNGGSAAGDRCMFYLGASAYRENILLDGKNKKVYVCYNNPGEAREVSLTVYYAGSDNKTGSGIAGSDPTVTQNHSVSTTVQLKGNMAEGEWAVAVFDFADLNLFSANRNATMIAFEPGGELYLRAIVFK